MSTPTNPTDSLKPEQQPRVSTQPDADTGKKLTRVIALLGVVLVLAFTFAFWVHWHDQSKADAAAREIQDALPIVNVVAASASQTIYPLELPGNTEAWDQSPIYPRVDGYVATWTANIGDHVKQGQVLATIDTPELDQQLIAARARASASAAQAHVAETGVSFAKLSYDRWRDSPKGVVSEQEREEKQAGYEEAVARLTAAKEQNKLDGAEVGRYTALESFKNITAPYDGIIQARHIDIGNLVSAGSSGNSYPLYNIARFETIRVFVNVPQKASAEVKNGLDAEVTCDRNSGQIFHGKVARDAFSMDPQSRTQRTEIDIENKDLKLVPNSFVQVIFQLDQRGFPEVPAAAILSRVGGEQIAVVNSQNKIEFRRITTARDNGDSVVIASGLAVGEKVALNLSSAITSGEEVKTEQDASDVKPDDKQKTGPKPTATAPVEGN